MLNNYLIKNPIIPGFFPDPSICRKDNDYYLVNSSFSYFPGVPLFRSRDLANWEHIGNILNRPSQLSLDRSGHNQGIYAPTLRYHNGTFYLITTLVGEKDFNFIVTATDPCGKWSDPYVIEGAKGIDPSLFFDEDGKSYYVGMKDVDQPKFRGNTCIYVHEIDLKQMKLVGEESKIWFGALRNVDFPEGPHIYKRNGFYYLLTAEGGTYENHSIVIGRSRNIREEYENNPKNPILTHRHLGQKYPIVNVGHGDLIEASDGNWWMVCLGQRPYSGYSGLGRETFLSKVDWESDWPVINRGVGRLEDTVVVSHSCEQIKKSISFREDFVEKQLRPKWLMLRTPRENWFNLTEREGFLRLQLRPQKITDKENPSFLCLRQQSMNFIASTALDFQTKQSNETAGLVIIQNDQYLIKFEVGFDNNSKIIMLSTVIKGEEKLLSKQRCSDGKIYLKIVQKGLLASFLYRHETGDELTLTDCVDVSFLSTEIARGFVGNCVGIYGSSNGFIGTNYVDFDYFEIKYPEE